MTKNDNDYHDNNSNNINYNKKNNSNNWTERTIDMIRAMDKDSDSGLK